MKRSSLVALALVAVVAACEESSESRTYQGYVEGEYVLIAPEESGRIAKVLVKRGQVVAAGDQLFAMESTDIEAERAEAAARLAQAQAQLADLLRSRMRPAEMAVIEASIIEAEATLREAELELGRQEQLAQKNFATQSDLDTALATRDRAKARLASLRSELDVARLPGRDHVIAAAEENMAAAGAALAHAAWRLDQRAPTAPYAGVVEDVIRRAGEIASPTTPVISLLPPENRKVRFFIPEGERSSMRLGDRISVACDGCPIELAAEISFIASDAEFTPPIIFSVESREKLVYMVEAVPLDGAAELPPGQPVDIALNAP